MTGRMEQAREATMDKLEPCPFCGGEGETWQDGDPRYPWNVTFKHIEPCVLQLVPTDFFEAYKTEAEAIAAWSRRPTDTRYGDTRSRLDAEQRHNLELSAMVDGMGPPALCPDSIVAAVQFDLSSRSARGLAKYGTTLDRTDLSATDWDNHLYEELLDAALYMKRRMTGGLCQRTLEAAANLAWAVPDRTETSNYEKGRFDGVADYRRAILALGKADRNE